MRLATNLGGKKDLAKVIPLALINMGIITQKNFMVNPNHRFIWVLKT